METYLRQNDNLKKWRWNSTVSQEKIRKKQRNALLTISTHEVFICDGISLRGIKGMHTCWFVSNWSSTIPRIKKHNQLLSSFITFALYFQAPAVYFRLIKLSSNSLVLKRFQCTCVYILTCYLQICSNTKLFHRTLECTLSWSNSL